MFRFTNVVSKFSSGQSISYMASLKLIMPSLAQFDGTRKYGTAISTNKDSSLNRIISAHGKLIFARDNADNGNKPNNTVKVYTDASLYPSRTAGEGIMGIGIYVENVESLCRSQVISNGTPDIVRAEMFAVIYALWNLLRWKESKYQNVDLFSDSKATVEYANERRAGSAFHKERLVLGYLMYLCKVEGMTVNIQHIKRNSVEGIKKADKFAGTARKGITNKTLLPHQMTTEDMMKTLDMILIIYNDLIH